MAKYITKPFIQMCMDNLAKAKQIFQNEAQFQFNLARELKEQLAQVGNYEILLEHTFMTQGASERKFTDIVIKCQNGEYVAIELKYKKKELDCAHYGVGVRHDGAQDFGRYEFLRDVEKNEKHVNGGQAVKAFSIILTNDHLYWSAPQKTTYMYAPFRLDDMGTGKVVRTGKFDWVNGTPSKAGARSATITLSHTYTDAWTVYPVCAPNCPHYKLQAGHDFKYLTFER